MTDSNQQNSNSIVLKAQNLTKIYLMGEVEVPALKSVSLEFIEHELTVLLGASGSGKSTLLNIIGGLDTATSGDFFYRNENLTNADENTLTEYRRKTVGFVFQFYNLIPSLTALENVELVTDIALNPLTPKDALDLVGLSERQNHFPSQLSGGEQQRVAIARAIAKQPELLLCDEPTGALDYNTGKVVLEVIERINKELGATTVLITHNASISQMADRVVKLRSGEVIEKAHNTTKISPSELTW